MERAKTTEEWDTCLCGWSEIYTDYVSKERSCTKCGLIQENIIITYDPEWRMYGAEDLDNVRTGIGLTKGMYDRGLGTAIQWGLLDGQGRYLRLEDRKRHSRLRKWQSRIVSDSKERNYIKAFSILNHITSKLKLHNEIKETSADIYRKAMNAGYLKGRTILTTVAACVYIACRQRGAIRSLEDIAKVAKVTRKELARSFRYLHKHLNPKLPRINKYSLLTKYADTLALSLDVERMAYTMLDIVSKEMQAVKRSSLVSGVIYLSARLSNEHRSQNDIARACQVSDVTVRKMYQQIFSLIDVEMRV